MRRILREARGMTANTTLSTAITAALALAALVAGYLGWGWRGLVLGATVIAFVLLLQFSRALRVMRQAAGQPKGSVASAVMLQSKLQTGMRLARVMQLAGSFGLPAPATRGDEETFVWRDEGGASVHVTLSGGRVQRWQLERDA
jgi:hypothetical protein